MAIKAYYTEISPHTGRPLFLVSDRDYEKIRAGYGCPHCLEDYNGMYLARCPLCGHQTDFGGGDFIPVVPDHLVPEDPSLLGHPDGDSRYFDEVRSAS